ncbi:Hypothetical protein SMAX5B_000072 [Scophthalmus maximus]|uniref:Uncharacterized protein n=1 Tax=Scophthalmus maximus TaxID=52904 RepID=A0A2U9CUX3_SCOMX|nr:Hypothetical protein SMAX5B_000072 [Scophthalmus maximus]
MDDLLMEGSCERETGTCGYRSEQHKCVCFASAGRDGQQSSEVHSDQSAQQHQPDLDSIFMVCKRTITFRLDSPAGLHTDT